VIKKERRNPLKPIVRAALAFAVITAGEFVVFNHYNSLFTTKAVQAERQSTSPSPTTSQLTGIHVLNSQVLAVSDDGTQLAYIDTNSVLHVFDVASHQEVYKLQLDYQPVFLTWIRNDYLFVGTEAQQGGLTDLRLSTIAIGSGTVRLINDFSGFAPTSTFKKVSFSPYTNDVYILIGGQTATILYHYDTNSNLNQIDLGGRYVSNVAVTATTNHLFFQDFALGTPNVLEYKNHQVNLIQRNTALLRVINDTMYYGALDSNGLVTTVFKYENGTSSQVTALSTAIDPKAVFINQAGQVIVLTAQSFKNLATHKSTPIATDATLINAYNALFVLGSNGKLSINR